MTMRDAFNQFVSPTLASLQGAVEKAEATVASTKIALEGVEKSLAALLETIDAAEAPLDHLDEHEVLERRQATLLALLARQQADLARKREALNQHLHADEIAKDRKQKKSQVKSVEEGVRAALAWTPKLAPALNEVAKICDGILDPLYRTSKLYPGVPGFDEIAAAIRAEIVDAGLGEIVGIRAPGDDGVKRTSYRMVGSERVEIEKPEPPHVPLSDALKARCAQAVENYRIQLGLVSPPAPSPAPPPAYVDPREAAFRAEKILQAMARTAGRIRPELDTPGARPFDPTISRG